MKRKTLASLALAGLVLAGSIMPAQAAVNVVPDGHEPATKHTEATTTEDVCMWQTADANGDEAQCDVYAKIGSSFTVTIPKKITLDGSTRTGSYTVSCKGDIAG
ncbi:MAG: hypothetical protein SPI20_08735, partial [Ruminococcus callidus]|nr:hypothetical protein [Ruminococcus sp.]MDY6145778.1 hypothetical protein [Ruminococcus callidus]